MAPARALRLLRDASAPSPDPSVSVCLFEWVGTASVYIIVTFAWEFKKYMHRADTGGLNQHVSERFAPFAARLQELFAAMDAAYDAVAGRYGFHCSGCEDNCCRTRFHHHTYLEVFLLRRGLEKLEPEQRAEIESRANDACREKSVTSPDIGTRQRMCPLNIDGLCRLYEYRPMICRLHGIPHVLRRPDGYRTVGSGCAAFQGQCGSRSEAVLDRTPHYKALAALEQEFRRAMGLTDRVKSTVAGIIFRLKI